MISKSSLKTARSLIVLLSCFGIFSCKKDSTSPTPVSKPSKLDLLTANVFIYDSVYTNWGLQNQTVVYVMNGSSNAQDWSDERLKLYVDGTFDEILPTGIWRSGTWSMNSDSTVLSTSGAGYSNTANVESLTQDHFIWVDPVHNQRGVQTPKK